MLFIDDIIERISLFNCVLMFFRMLFRNVLYEKSRPRRSKRFTQYQDVAWGKNYTVLFLTLLFVQYQYY